MLEETLKKRWHERYFNEKIPEKSLIESILRKTFEICPSKQLVFPYKIEVLGPDRDYEKKRFRSFCDYHTTRSANYEQHKHKSKPFTKEWETGSGTAALAAPYVLIFTSRQVDSCEVSEANWNRIVSGRGGYFSTVTPHFVSDANLIEVGMFSMILTTLCIENDLRIGYCLCMPGRRYEHWNRVRDITKGSVLFCLGIGYSDSVGPSDEVLKGKEHRPPFENVVKI